MQTILGAGSPLSSELAKELSSFTKDIKLISRNPKKVNDSDILMSADLRDENLINSAVRGSEVVYVTIGFEYKTSVWREQWPKFMKSLISSCSKHHTKIVYLDNMYMYDRYYLSHMTEETPVNPSTEKGRIRAEVYYMLMNAAEKGIVEAVVGRSADFYGPGIQTSAFAQSVFNNLLKDKNPQWIGRLDVIHSYTYSIDIARALALLGNTPAAFNQVWHLPTSPEKITAGQWIKLFMKEMKKEKKIRIISSKSMSILGLFIPVLKELKEIYYQLDRDYYFDSSKFNSQFNYTPVKPEYGVKKTVMHEFFSRRNKT